jgi:hypothetical protein
MIAIGVLLLLSAIGLIWFRRPLTATRIDDGNSVLSMALVNEAGETSLLWTAGLIGLLGIGLIIAGAVRPKHIAAAVASDEVKDSPPMQTEPVAELVHCTVCTKNVMVDADRRCPSCGWSI